VWRQSHASILIAGFASAQTSLNRSRSWCQFTDWEEGMARSAMKMTGIEHIASSITRVNRNEQYDSSQGLNQRSQQVYWVYPQLITNNVMWAYSVFLYDNYTLKKKIAIDWNLTCWIMDGASWIGFQSLNYFIRRLMFYLFYLLTICNKTLKTYFSMVKILAIGGLQEWSLPLLTAIHYI